ncbi:MAG: 2-C-methyl-D-erythritol 2,4-cyclodiphosphate synthase [Pseudomonadota bacterium]
MFRIGNGYDVHAFESGDHVILCGVRIPHTQSLKAHSDGDVGIHALCDALLGAAGLGDIGRHFPDTDEAFKNIDSRVLLRRVITQLKDREMLVENVDVTIVAQRPKLATHIDDMERVLAEDLGIGGDRVNVKATTTERLGFVGREEGIAAYAVASLACSTA